MADVAAFAAADAELRAGSRLGECLTASFFFLRRLIQLGGAVNQNGGP
jgi:hypothetical protein